MLMERDTITNIDSLPDELLFDILVRLAADYLYDRARLVCRRWWRIIRSDAFTTTHIQQHSTYGLVLTLTSVSPPRSIYVTTTQDGRVETSELSDMCVNETTANGLLVEFNTGALHVVNAATKQSFRLPSVPVPRRSRVYYRSRCGIAYSEASMEYKVTLRFSTADYGALTYLDIVTVGVDKSWRQVEIIPPLHNHFRSILHSFPVSSEGFLHWWNERYCLTMNVETEKFTMSEVPIPRYQRFVEVEYPYTYLPTGRHLTLLVRRGIYLWEVWEMRPAESGEWRKAGLPIIDLEPHDNKLLANGFYELRLSPIGWVKYPEVLAFCFWALKKTCILYNLETRKMNTTDLPHDIDDAAIVHRNSLVWLS